MPGIAFPTVGRLGLTSPLSQSWPTAAFYALGSHSLAQSLLTSLLFCVRLSLTLSSEVDLKVPGIWLASNPVLAYLHNDFANRFSAWL